MICLVFVTISSAALFFAVVESLPGLITRLPIRNIRYFAMHGTYRPDPVLVFTYRATAQTSRSLWRIGDLYEPGLGVRTQEVEYVSTRDGDGFRIGSSIPPYEVAVVGDSYIEIGESESRTLPDLLRQRTGRSTMNLGRGWYGPYQYMEVIRRYALPKRPRRIILCFFAGNDIDDIREYKRWLTDGVYHFYTDPTRISVMNRFLLAMGDTGRHMKRNWRSPAASVSLERPPGVHPELGILNLRGQEVPLRIAYWSPRATTAELLASAEWGSLRELLAEFRRISLEHGAAPALVYIPTKSEVYDDFIVERSGAAFRTQLEAHRPFRDSRGDALMSIAAELGLTFVDLRKGFRALAAQGVLLYYPFDTHWNVDGRTAAAEIITRALGLLPRI
jgi:hypothetical protein